MTLFPLFSLINPSVPYYQPKSLSFASLLFQNKRKFLIGNQRKDLIIERADTIGGESR